MDQMSRFVFVIVFALLLFAAMFLAIGILARDRALADADRELMTRAQFVAHALDRTLQQRMIQAFTFAALPSLRGFAASDETTRDARAAIARTELAAIVNADPNIRAATIVDKNGIVIMTTDDAMYANWRARVFVSTALRGHLHASTPAREANAVVQFYSAPILNNAGDVAGALVLRVNAQEMWNALAAPYDVIVVDEIGVRLMDRSYTQLFVALAPVPADLAAQSLMEKRYGTEITEIRSTNLTDLASAAQRGGAAQLVYRDATGRAIHAATQRITTNPWTVIVSESEDDILLPARQALYAQIGIAIASALITLALVYAAQSVFAIAGRKR
jgi:C4-dicarboxylate-specific signal transduction histidine kinase